jgi:hypothetical protein
MSPDTPPLPDRREWARFGISDVVELHAGKQSRVARTQRDGVELAVKLTDRRFVDPAELGARMNVARTAAAGAAEIVAPPSSTAMSPSRVSHSATTRSTA